MSQTKSVQKTEIRAKTPYNKAQGYATKSCCPSIANAEIKILEAEKLHHPIIVAVRRIPTIPCKENTTANLDSRIMGRRQYPRTLATQPNETPVILIKFNKQNIPKHPVWLCVRDQCNWILPASSSVAPKARQNTTGPAKSVSFMMLPSDALSG